MHSGQKPMSGLQRTRETGPPRNAPAVSATAGTVPRFGGLGRQTGRLLLSRPAYPPVVHRLSIWSGGYGVQMSTSATSHPRGWGCQFLSVGREE